LVSRSRSVGACLLPLVLIGLLVGGCGSDSKPGIRTEYFPFSESDQALYDSAKNARYRFHAGDLFAVDFKYMNELDQEDVLVLPDGHCNMTGLDDIVAAGLTVSELDAVLTAHFAKDYRNAELTVIVQQLGLRQVYVFGKVMQPGVKDMETYRMTVPQAVAAAGGFDKGASLDEILVIRITDQGYTYRICDLAHLEKSEPLSFAQLDIQANDVIYVPSSALGDLKYFGDTVLASVLKMSSLFFDVYAIANLNKVNAILR